MTVVWSFELSGLASRAVREDPNGRGRSAHPLSPKTFPPNNYRAEARYAPIAEHTAQAGVAQCAVFDPVTPLNRSGFARVRAYPQCRAGVQPTPDATKKLSNNYLAEARSAPNAWLALLKSGDPLPSLRELFDLVDPPRLRAKPNPLLAAPVEEGAKNALSENPKSSARGFSHPPL